MEWWHEDLLLQGSLMFRFEQKLKHIKNHIIKWNKDTFGDILKEKNVIEKQMEDIQQHIIFNWTFD